MIDIRNFGLVAAIEFEPVPASPARAGMRFSEMLRDNVLVRQTGDIIALSPPLIIEDKHIDQIVSTLRAVCMEIA